MIDLIKFSLDFKHNILSNYVINIKNKMPKDKSFKISTECVHHDNFVDKNQDMRMVMSPLYQGSTVIYNNYDAFTKYCRKNIKNIDDVNPFPEYGRIGNPTNFEFANTMNMLEKADFTIVTNGGMSAVTLSILTFLKSGDHALFSDGTYTSTKKFIENVLPKYNIEYSYYDNFDEKNGIEKNIKSNTKIIFFESCASGTFEIEDIDKIAKLGKKHNCVTICDNTMLTPILFNPLTHGINVTVHSASKFILGHADAMLGTVSVKKEHFKQLYDYSTLIGNHASAQSCYLAIRGVKTLPLRVLDSAKRGKTIFDAIKSHPVIEQILHPYAFEDSEQKSRLEKYAKNQCNSLFSVVFKRKLTDKELKKFFDSLKIIQIGLSWGGFESLCTPYDLSHRIGKIKQLNNKTIFRFYIGMEDEGDLKSDIIAALDTLC